MSEYPHPTSDAVSAVMRGNRKVGSQPEVRLRSALHALGLRFRKNHPVRLPGRVIRPDVVFTRARVAVFVDGCFWHRCPSHGNSPKANTAYWGPKLDRNVERDQEVDALLVEHGWTTLRVWEHEDALVSAQLVAVVVRDRTRGDSDPPMSSSRQ